MGVDTIIQKRCSDHEDANQKQALEESLNEIEKKWSSLHVFLKDYRDKLVKTKTFSELSEQIDLWFHEKIQIITNITITKIQSTTELREIESILLDINKNIQEIKQFNETKVKSLSQLAVQLYGKYLKFFSTTKYRHKI